MCTFPDIEKVLQPLEDAIYHHFLPAITGKQAFRDVERDLLLLPERQGGLRIPKPITITT